MKRLGERLRQIRERKGLSQEQVALDAGITVNTYGCIERGRMPRGAAINPTLDTLFRILEALETTAEELTDES